ncbi:Pca operon regulatory protein [Tepidimonas alkaliphilus]|uniref:Pca operon regulatory protein n=1 Tax=Tepidimonas alkaliphilus TaxID=2588942 RepID=A0A554WA99_9BURK|nr:IclR family transcriptional regulator C-terminal domain-containing protein [Tepidimonas alkaliphilus]TSE20482.1 Pca operon regulatory protein [Tepidimonas alkaliphilus]
MTLAAADTIAGLIKGLAVLESFDTERQRLNATLAAQRAGLSRAAARRHLLTLAHLGYLETDGHDYWLAPKVLRLAGRYLASARLPRTVQPVLDRLAARAGEAFSVAVLDDEAVVVVARSVPAGAAAGDALSSSLGEPLAARPRVRWLAHGLHLGARLPAHATSTGRVLLAALPAAQQRQWLAAHVGPDGRLPRLTPYTVTEPAALRRILRQVRQQDFCLCSEEHEPGVHAVAVPLRDARGRTVAALNAVLSTQRLNDGAVTRELLPLLQEAAAGLRPLL